MDQQKLFFESLNEAIRDTVTALGGPKKSGPGEDTTDFDPADDDHPLDQAGLVNGEPLGSVPHETNDEPAEESELDVADIRRRARDAIDDGVPRRRLSEVCGVSEPTIPNLLDPTSKPWPKTLEKVEAGLARLGY